MSPRRQFAFAVLACAAGAGLALIAAGRPWLTHLTTRPAPLPALHESRTGAAIAPWLTPLGFVALAGAAALLATKSVGRLAVAALLVASGVGVAAAGLYGLSLRAGVWPGSCLLGGVLILVGGAVALARGRRWPALGSRYERASNHEHATRPVDVWAALDRGEDPTA